jgi:hypothetical protein
MPYIVRKIRNQPYYSVKNPETGHVHSKHTTRKNAMAQVRLLQSVGGMPKPTPFAPRHNLFRSPAPAPAPVPPPRPPTPELPPARPFSLGYRADEFLRQNPQIAMPPPAPRQPRPRAPAPASSSASAPAPASSSASASSSFSSRPTIRSFLDRDDLDRIQANIRDGLTMTPVLVPIYSTLKKMKNENERARYAVALYNLGYTKASIKEMIRNGQFLQLMRHIQSNLDTLIPAKRGGKKHGGMKRKLDSLEPMPKRPGFGPAPADYVPPDEPVPGPSGRPPAVRYVVANVPALVENTPAPVRDIITVLMQIEPRKMQILSPSATVALAIAFYNIGWTGRTIRDLEYSRAKTLLKYVRDNVRDILR